MRKLKYIICLLLTTLSCQKEHKTFTQAALNDTFLTPQGQHITLQNILNQHAGKTVFIDVWASWCGDCLQSIPQVKKLQQQFTNVAFVYLSLDRNQDSWQHAMARFNLKGQHYFMPNGKACSFAKFANISWIPRYLVINKQGNIELFKAVKTTNNKLIEALKK